MLAEVRVLAEAQVQPGLRVQLMVTEKSAPVVARVLAAAQELSSFQKQVDQSQGMCLPYGIFPRSAHS